MKNGSNGKHSYVLKYLFDVNADTGRALLVHVLNQNDGDLTETASRLGVARATLESYMAEYGVVGKVVYVSKRRRGERVV